MTDKQIIEYKHIKCTRDDCCHYCGSVFCGYVDDIENLEKAYKAKEQECERWKSNFNGKVSAIEELLKQLDQLKAENDELKKTVDDLLHKPEIQDKILWKIDNEALLGSKDAYIYKLEKTLTEIKEIVFPKNQLIITDSPIILKIQEKISECEVE